MEFDTNIRRPFTTGYVNTITPIVFAISIVLIILFVFVIVVDIEHYTLYFNDTHHIMQTFHHRPNKEDFLYITLRKGVFDNKRYQYYWLWAVAQVHPDYIDSAQRAVVDQWAREITLGLHQARGTSPTSEILQCIWYMYFATGDLQYAEMIRRVAVKNIPIVSSYARNSYEKIMKRDHKESIMGTALDKDEPINDKSSTKNEL